MHNLQEGREEVEVRRLAFISLVLLTIVMVICAGCGGEQPVKYVPWTGEGPPPPPKPGTRWVIPEEESTPPPSQAQPAPSSPPQVSPSQPTTFEPIVLTGSGSKTSPPFTVTTDEWIIDWSYTSDDPEWYVVFGFFVYPREETTSFVESILFPQNTNGSTYSYAGAGEYYIKVEASNIKSWNITIRPAQ